VVHQPVAESYEVAAAVEFDFAFDHLDVVAALPQPDDQLQNTHHAVGFFVQNAFHFFCGVFKQNVLHVLGVALHFHEHDVDGLRWNLDDW